MESILNTDAVAKLLLWFYASILHKICNGGYTIKLSRPFQIVYILKKDEIIGLWTFFPERVRLSGFCYLAKSTGTNSTSGRNVYCDCILGHIV